MYYLITIKRNAMEFTSIQDIRDMSKKLFKYQIIPCYCMELDTRQRLHQHSLVQYETTLYYKKYQVNGWTVHFRKLTMTTLDHVVNYINKNNNKIYQHCMEWISYAHYNYMFI